MFMWIIIYLVIESQYNYNIYGAIEKYVRLILSSFAAVSSCLISFGNRYDVVKTTEPSWDVDKRWVQYLLDKANCPRAVKIK